MGHELPCKGDVDQFEFRGINTKRGHRQHASKFAKEAVSDKCL